MNKSEMVDPVAARVWLSKSAAGDAVDAVFAEIGDAFAEGRSVRLAGFGSFTTNSRLNHGGRKPRAGESLLIPALQVPSFKVLKEMVNGR